MNFNIRELIQNNIIIVSIALFLVLFILFNMAKPKFAYTNKGHIRLFGTNYKNKTVFPIWLVTIVLAIAVYFFVMYYLAYPRINFKKM